MSSFKYGLITAGFTLLILIIGGAWAAIVVAVVDKLERFSAAVQLGALAAALVLTAFIAGAVVGAR